MLIKECHLEVVIGGSYTVGRLVSVPGRRYDGGKSSRGSGAVAPLLDYETRGEVVSGGDDDGPAEYFSALHNYRRVSAE